MVFLMLSSNFYLLTRASSETAQQIAWKPTLNPVTKFASSLGGQ